MILYIRTFLLAIVVFVFSGCANVATRPEVAVNSDAVSVESQAVEEEAGDITTAEVAIIEVEEPPPHEELQQERSLELESSTVLEEEEDENVDIPKVTEEIEVLSAEHAEEEIVAPEEPETVIVETKPIDTQEETDPPSEQTSQQHSEQKQKNSSQKTQEQKSNSKKEKDLEQQKNITVAVGYISPAGSGTYTVEVPAGASVQDAMNAARAKGFAYTSTSFGGLGAYVDSVGSVQEDTKAGMYWVYSINGQKASTGISSKIIQNKDTIQWNYEKSY